MAIIQIEHVSKTFQTKDGTIDALKDVSLNIEAGDIYGIIGMSGAGKSTLVRCINHIEVPTSGTVVVQDKELGGLSDKELRKQREHIGMIFQHFNLLMQKSVLDNVCFPLFIQGKSKAEARKKAYELLEIVGLRDRAKAYPSQLSGGQKQRVAIARALASDPQILLCDEATSALDPQTTSSILELLKDINQRFGITIVVITHQMAVVREICNQVAIMKDGYLEENQSPASIFNDVEWIQSEDLPSAEEIKENSLHYYVTETKMVYSARGNLVDPETYYGKFNKDYAEQTSLGSYIEAMMQRWRERNTKEYSEKDDVEYEKAVDSLNSSFISIEGCDQNDLDYLSEFIESGTAELDDDGILVIGGGSVMDYSLFISGFWY